MEQQEYAAKLSFVCSPLVLDQLDDLVVKGGYRSRGEMMRVWIQRALEKQRISQSVMAEIEKHHKRLNTVRPRRHRG